MTAAEADGERAEREGATPVTTKTGTTSDTEEKPEDPAFELTRTRNSAHSGPSVSSWSRPSAPPALLHTASQNGYGCDNYTGDRNDMANGGAGTLGSWTLNDKDPYEVAFDSGDADPMSPRSMKTVRKWLIVSVLSGAGLCLYVTPFPPAYLRCACIQCKSHTKVVLAQLLAPSTAPRTLKWTESLTVPASF